jgi:hypothetical protein
MKKTLVVTAAAMVLLLGATPALAKRPKPDTPLPTLSLELTCHMEPGGEIPFAHIDQTSAWADLGGGRYTLIVILPSSGHSHQIFHSPGGTDYSHMDNGAEPGGTYVGNAYIESKRGKVVATATAEVTC